MWQIDLVELIRALTFDYDTPPKYTNQRLERLLVSAAYFVINDGGFEDYTADLVGINIVPDPTEDTDYYNPSLSNLIAIKAACLLDNGEARIAAGQAVDISDGDSRIAVRGLAAARLAILQAGWCRQYEQELQAYFLGDGDTPAGAAVLSPFRNVATTQAYAFDDDCSPNTRYR